MHTRPVLENRKRPIIDLMEEDRPPCGKKKSLKLTSPPLAPDGGSSDRYMSTNYVLSQQHMQQAYAKNDQRGSLESMPTDILLEISTHLKSLLAIRNLSITSHEMMNFYQKHLQRKYGPLFNLFNDLHRGEINGIDRSMLAENWHLLDPTTFIFEYTPWASDKNIDYILDTLNDFPVLIDRPQDFVDSMIWLAQKLAASGHPPEGALVVDSVENLVSSRDALQPIVEPVLSIAESICATQDGFCSLMLFTSLHRIHRSPLELIPPILRACYVHARAQNVEEELVGLVELATNILRPQNRVQELVGHVREMMRYFEDTSDDMTELEDWLKDYDN